MAWLQLASEIGGSWDYFGEVSYRFSVSCFTVPMIMLPRDVHVGLLHAVPPTHLAIGRCSRGSNSK